MAPIVQFKAGKAFRRGETNWVDPSPNRGLVYLQEEDDLLHFYYKDLESGVVDDLIIFPGDATFTKATDRVHVLKFNSSSDRHFFWHQDVDSSKDDEVARKVNELFGAEAEPEPEPEQAMEVEGPTSSAPAASSSNLSMETPAPATRAPSSAPEAPKKALGSQLADILAKLSSQTGASGEGFASAVPEFLLPDVLPPSLLTPLLTPALTTSLTPFLPTEVPQTAASLTRAIESPEFKRSVASLDRALRTGALGPLIAGLGLGEESAMGVEAFLEGIQKQADEELEREGKTDGASEEKMEED